MADRLDVDRDGRLYVATRFGVQISDRAGKVYQHKLNVRGAPSWDKPGRPAPPRL